MNFNELCESVTGPEIIEFNRDKKSDGVVDIITVRYKGETYYIYQYFSDTGNKKEPYMLGRLGINKLRKDLKITKAIELLPGKNSISGGDFYVCYSMNRLKVDKDIYDVLSKALISEKERQKLLRNLDPEVEEHFGEIIGGL